MAKNKMAKSLSHQHPPNSALHLVNKPPNGTSHRHECSSMHSTEHAIVMI